MQETIRQKSPSQTKRSRAANRRGQSLEGSLPLGRSVFATSLLTMAARDFSAPRRTAVVSIRSGNSPCRFTVALAERPFPARTRSVPLPPAVRGACSRPLSIVAHASIYNCLAGGRKLHVFAFPTGDRSVATQVGVNREVLRETSAERPVCDR